MFAVPPLLALGGMTLLDRVAGLAKAGQSRGRWTVRRVAVADTATIVLRNRLEAPMRIAVELEPLENAAATAAMKDRYTTASTDPAMAGLGFYFSRRQTSLDRYLLAERNMGWLPVGLSLMAALNSGIDYLTQPSATIQYGLLLALGTLSWLAIYPWVSFVVFPFFRRLHVYSKIGRAHV